MKWLNAPRPWILLASLSVNLFLVGLIVAAVTTGPHGAGWNKGRPPPPARYMIRALGEEARPAIEKVMRLKKVHSGPQEKPIVQRIKFIARL